MNKVKPIRMWALVVGGKRSDWIYHGAIRKTRKAVREEWLDGIDPANHPKWLERTRIVRVTVTIDESY